MDLELKLKLDAVTPMQQPPQIFYICVPTSDVGVTEDHRIVTGLALQPYLQEGHDPLEDQIQEIGAEGVYDIPPLRPGGIYEVFVTNISRDWESGYVDDWDIKLVEVTDQSRLREIKQRREEIQSEGEAE